MRLYIQLCNLVASWVMPLDRCDRVLFFAAALHCEPRLFESWADQDKPHDQGDIMARVGSKLVNTLYRLLL